MNRRGARELTLHLIFAGEFTGLSGEELLRRLVNEEEFASLRKEYPLYEELPPASQEEYVRRAVTGVMSHLPELDAYIEKHHGLPRAKNKPARDYKCENGRIIAAGDALDSRLKTRVAEPLAEILATLPDEARRFPADIRALFQKISDDHGLTQVAKEAS